MPGEGSRGSVALAFPARDPISVEIAGRMERFPVGRIFCVGRNYHAHALEMGDAIDKSAREPFWFLKDASHLVPSGARAPYPPGTSDYHHEMEWVVALGAGGTNVAVADANALVFGYACGLDMTRRDLQNVAKEHRRPWDVAKNFEGAAVLGSIHRREDVGKIEQGRIELAVAGETRQASDLSRLIWSVDELVAHLSTLYRLEAGDLIYTGTPEGVGPVERGDVLVGTIERLGEVRLEIC